MLADRRKEAGRLRTTPPSSSPGSSRHGLSSLFGHLVLLFFVIIMVSSPFLAVVAILASLCVPCSYLDYHLGKQ